MPDEPDRGGLERLVEGDEDAFESPFVAAQTVGRLEGSPLVAAAARREWNWEFPACALSAIAAAKGFPLVAEAAQEMTPEVAAEFLEWFFSR